MIRNLVFMVFLIVFVVKLVPLLAVKADFLAKPSLKILYCYSCGYQKMFQDFSNIVQQQFPDILIEGGNYEPFFVYLFLCRLLGILKFALMLCVASGVQVFRYFGMEQPFWYTWCVNNKIYSNMMIFFVSNIIEGQLMATGAFEIFLNDMPVWSKLETGQIPQPNVLIKIIQNNLQFSDDYLNVE